MRVKIIVVGELLTNCYIIISGRDCLIIDPGSDYNKIIEEIGDINVKGILITHNHFDHIEALDSLVSKFSVPVYNFDNTVFKKIFNLEIGVFKFHVISNPGHSSDSISFYFSEINSMFVGDFVFKGTVGRCGLPSGDFNLMKKSIIEIKNLPPDIILYPGHGEETSIGAEISSNYYFK